MMIRTRFPSLLLVALAVAPAVFFGSGASRPPSAEAATLAEVKKLTASDAQANDLFGLRVTVDGDTAVVGAFGEDAGGDGAGAAYIFERDEGGTDNWGQVKKLSASDAEAGDQFGISVAINGDTVVVGAQSEDAGGAQAGAAYVFERDQGGTDNWGEVKKLTASDAQSLDLFGSSVAVSVDTVIVGAAEEDAGGSSAGAAYVFGRDEGGTDNWGEVKKLTASDAEAGDLFGVSVAISQDTAVVGAFGEDAGGNNSGAAYVFERDEGGTDNWGEVKKLAASDADAADQFGAGVAISGDTALVGANFENAGGIQAGAAYLFERDEGGADNWGEVKKLTASDAQANDFFGETVAISGDAAAVGAPGEDSAANQAGAAYIFRRNEGGLDNWGETDKLTASDAEAGDVFGRSVSIGADTAVVGASGEDAGGSDAGAAYVFGETDSDGDGWPDAEDNCPTVATPWFVPPGDDDCDGFDAADETFITTDPNDDCPDNTSDDAWPPDFNNDTGVDIFDVNVLKPAFFSTPPGPPYTVRVDLNTDSMVDIFDVIIFKPFFFESCPP